jgi:hypothetical protein
VKHAQRGNYRGKTFIEKWRNFCDNVLALDQRGELDLGAGNTIHSSIKLDLA